MSERLGLVLAVALLLGSAPAWAKQRVAVIVVGGDASAAGSLQKAAEDELLAARGVEIVRADDVAAKVGKAEPVPATATFPKQPGEEADKLLGQVVEIYFDAEYRQAQGVLHDVEKIYVKYKDVLPVDRLVTLFVWKSALAAGRDDNKAARGYALQALVLRPDYAPDANTFSPAFVTFFNGLRDALPTQSVTLMHLPAHATIRVDDHAAEGRMQIPSGTHKLEVSAPGFRRIEQSFTVKKGMVLKLPMAVYVEDPEGLVTAATEAQPSPGQHLRVERLAEALGADGIALVAIREDRAVPTFWWKGEPDRRTGTEMKLAGGEAKIAQWIGQEARRGPASGLTALGKGWQSRLDAGVFFAYRTRSLSKPDAPVSAAGGGPRFVFEIKREAFVAEAEAWYATYQPSTIEVTLPGGDIAETNAGSRFYGRVSAGYRKLFGGGGGEPVVLSVLVGGSYEQQQIDDVSNEFGPSGLLPSFTRIAVDVRGRVDYQLSRKIGLSGGLGISPYGTWVEDPADTLGTEPFPLGGLALVGLTWRPANRWHVGLDYGGEFRMVTFKGRGVAYTQVPPEDTRLTETVHLVTLGVRRVF